jgi:hypothetical protein
METFDWIQYLNNYSDLRRAGIKDQRSAYRHYLRYGKSEGRTDGIKKKKIYLSTNVRDEKNLEEWVDYHILLGFEHILIVDHLSIIPVSEILKNSIHIDKITIKRYKVSTGIIKSDIIKKIVIPFVTENDCDMFIHLDADEYMYLKNHTNIVEYINYINGWGKQIVFYWLLFGSNYLEYPPTNNSLIYNYNRCSYDKSIYANNIVGKCMVDPKILDLKTINNTKILYPHSWYITKNAGIVDVNGNNLKLDKLCRIINNSNKVNINDNAYIYHYELQSWKTYYLRKVSRNRDDINCKYTDLINDKTIFDTYYNEVVNNSIIELYDTLKNLTKDLIT